MEAKWEEKQIAYARERFSEFVANFKDYGDLQTLDWRHKSGESNYHVHYIFDTKQQCMHISGDLGSACFWLTWEPTFANMHHRIRDPWYIVGKLECSADKYVYPPEYVKAEIEDWYKDCEPQVEHYGDYELYLEELEEYEEAIEAFISAHDYHEGFQYALCEKMNAIEELDGEWYEHNFGRCISTRVYCWLVGLEMAWEQLNRRKEQKDEVSE